MPGKLFGDGDFLNLDRSGGPVAPVGRGGFNFLDNVHSVDDLSENRVLGRSGREPIEIAVMLRVDEELGSAAVGAPCVCHRQRSRFVGKLVSFRMFVLDSAVWGASGAGPAALGILAVGAAKLNHEVIDNAVEMESIIEAVFSKIQEILRRDWHFVLINLSGEVA